MFTFVATRSGCFSEVRRFDILDAATAYAREFWSTASEEEDDFIVTECLEDSGNDDQPVVFSPSMIEDDW